MNWLVRGRMWWLEVWRWIYRLNLGERDGGGEVGGSDVMEYGGFGRV